MLAVMKSTEHRASAPVLPSFEQLLPTIQRQAQWAFGRMLASEREEMVAEAVANAYCAFCRLVALGKADRGYATQLARFAIRRVRCGRGVGTPANVHDLTSRYCQRANGLRVARLDRYEKYQAAWKEVLVEDPHAGPAEIAATRIDFAAWLQSLAPRVRNIAKLLATGESTGAAAQKFGVSPGRISQLRRKLEQAWSAFQGEPAVA